MGREVKRVPIGFDWPVGEVWFGYVLPAVPCELCGGTGRPKHGGKVTILCSWALNGLWESEFCPTCEGEGKVCPRVEVPTGPGWQMWETTTEGSPISPPCRSDHDLALWLAREGASAFGPMKATYSQWLGMIRGPGSAVSLEIRDGEIRSGVAAASDEEVAR